jgi:hypothetical protein
VKATPFRMKGTPLEGKNPRELRARDGLTRHHEVADSCVEQTPEGDDVLGNLSIWRTTSWMRLRIRSDDCRRGKPKRRTT